MEPTATPAPTPPEAPQPAAAPPAMDVVAAPPTEADVAAPTGAPVEASTEVSETPRSTEEPKATDDKAKAVNTKPAKPKNNGSSVTLAIVSTVIIVLGLAALAVLAYINQPK